MDIRFWVIKTPKQSFMDAWVQRVKAFNLKRIVKSLITFFFLHAPIPFLSFNFMPYYF